MTDTTRAVLDAAIDKFARAAIDAANALGAPDEFAAAKAAWAAIAPAITAHVEAEVARRIAAAPSVEDAIRAHDEAAQAEGAALALHRLPTGGDETYAAYTRAVEATEDAWSDLDRAIAADRERAIRAHDATWQAHDLERDAEVARWQGEAHALVRALKSIAAAVGAPDVPSGDGWAERVVPVVIGKAARPTPDEARRLVGEYTAAHGALVLLMNGEYDPFDDEGTRRAAAESTCAALLRALGVEA